MCAIMQGKRLKALIELFELRLANPQTRSNFRSDIKALDLWFSPFSGHEDELEILKFLRHEGMRLSPRSLRERALRLRKLYGFLKSHGFRRDIPVEMTAIPRFKDLRAPKAPTFDEINSLFRCLGTSSFSDLRDTTMIVLMIFEALRVVEVARLRRKDVNDRQRPLELNVSGKGNRLHTVKVLPQTDRLLRTYIGEADCSTQDALFYSLTQPCQALTPRGIRKRVDQLMNRAGVRKGYSCHSLRHFHLSVLAHAGVPLTELQRRARHADFHTTLKYIHNVDGIKSQRPEIERLMPFKVRGV